ncbi:MAG: hypothetical protein H6654_16395 [Ardenticatenaceae bacterium]|nr:hypothetical protein [Anaerolineales bacterium]MCB8939776.1 hypothetical protein [Ardenticatenaceae bacterium]MCB8975140.1 hypothetical protein [Ardenticatenaceae bacterium]
MLEATTLPIYLKLEPIPTIAAGQLQFGVQRGKTVIAVQDIYPEMTHLMAVLEVTAVPLLDQTFDWKGPFVHGRPRERFLYLNWGRQQTVGWHGMRRAKIPLGMIPTELVETAVVQKSSLLGSLNGIARDGGPIAASVKTVQWQIKPSE